MTTILKPLVILGLCCPIALWAAESCTDLQAENSALKARIAELELRGNAALPPSPVILPGTAAKPSPEVQVRVVAPYSRTGCSTGLFNSAPRARWQDADWQDLLKGMTAAEVETLLGVEHFDVTGGGNTIWQFGKCGNTAIAEALFSQGLLEHWRAPSQ